MKGGDLERKLSSLEVSTRHETRGMCEQHPTSGRASVKLSK